MRHRKHRQQLQTWLYKDHFGCILFCFYCFVFVVVGFFLFVCFDFGFVVIGSEPRALYMLDKCSTAEPHP